MFMESDQGLCQWEKNMASRSGRMEREAAQHLDEIMLRR
jgi:hypothetical protein